RAMLGGLHALARAARGIARSDRDQRLVQVPQGARLRALSRHRLSRPQGGRGVDGAERRDTRGDRQPRAGPATERAGAPGRGAPDSYRGAGSGAPWVASLSSAPERLAHGRQLLTSLYGEAVAGWELCISDAPPLASRVICAVPGELIEGVRAACAAQGGALLSLQPQLVAAYEAWRPSLPQANAWFVSVEQGSLAAARLGRYGWERVHGVRIGSDWMRELKRL